MSTPLSIRPPDELRQRIAELAAVERRSLHRQIIVLLEEAVQARGPGTVTEPAPDREPMQPRRRAGRPRRQTREEAQAARAVMCPHRIQPGSYCKRCGKVI